MDKAKKFTLKDIYLGIKLIFHHAREYKKTLWAIFALSLLISILGPIPTYLFGRFVDSVSHTSTFNVIGYLIPGYVIILALWFVVNICIYILNRAFYLRNLVFEENFRISYLIKASLHVFRLPISFHREYKIGETSDKIDRAARGGSEILSDQLIESFPKILSVFVSIAIVYTFNTYLFIVLLIGVTIYIIHIFISVRPTIGLQRQVNNLYSKARGNKDDAVINIKIVKDFTSEQYVTDKLNHEYRNVAMAVWQKLFRIRRNALLGQSIISLTTTTVGFLLALFLIRSGSLSVGELVIFSMYASQVFQPLSQLGGNWRFIQNGLISVEDAEKILTLPTEVYIPENVIQIKELKGKIEFRNVHFYYDEQRSILQDINLVINPGEKVALVGESGVGKSTLIELISGYYFAKEGEILIDDIDIKQLNLTQLRRDIGIVSQEITLFNDSILNNIKFGNFDKSQREVELAALQAHASDFIDRFPEKWNQVVGERGLKLSVGQKQRVAIARAILRNPKILILDEPTSALDAGSEKIITESLKDLMQGKTTFVIAHRLSTVREADKILVFKEGRIIEQGKHDELLKIMGGEYRRLHELQIGLHD